MTLQLMTLKQRIDSEVRVYAAEHGLTLQDAEECMDLQSVKLAWICGVREAVEVTGKSPDGRFVRACRKDPTALALLRRCIHDNPSFGALVCFDLSPLSVKG